MLIAAIRRRQRRAGLTESAVRPGGSAVVVRGGARIGWLNSSWPLAVLTFDESSAELRILLLSPMVVRRDEVIRVARRRGVWRFETASGRWDHITFGASGVGDALRQRGWPVER